MLQDLVCVVSAYCSSSGCPHKVRLSLQGDDTHRHPRHWAYNMTSSSFAWLPTRFALLCSLHTKRDNNSIRRASVWSVSLPHSRAVPCRTRRLASLVARHVMSCVGGLCPCAKTLGFRGQSLVGGEPSQQKSRSVFFYPCPTRTNGELHTYVRTKIVVDGA